MRAISVNLRSRFGRNVNFVILYRSYLVSYRSRIIATVYISLNDKTSNNPTFGI